MFNWIKNLIKQYTCHHVFDVRYDEEYDFNDDKYHIYKISSCTKCDKVITELVE